MKTEDGINNIAKVPVFVDPSHATFKSRYVLPISLAAVAAGADGLLIEVHHDPENAWVDPLNAVGFEAFGRLMQDIEKLAPIIGKTLKESVLS